MDLNELYMLIANGILNIIQHLSIIDQVYFTCFILMITLMYRLLNFTQK